MSGVVAYWEKECWSCDKPGAVLRKEFRVRPISAIDTAAMKTAWGDDWERWHSGSTHVLEERYIRGGVDEGWKPFSPHESRAAALDDVDHNSETVAVDPKLIEIWAEHGRANESAKQKAADESRKAAEAESNYQKQKRQKSAFEKLTKSKDKSVADAWNAYAASHSDDSAYKQRVSGDSEYMRLYRDAVDTETAVPKRVAIKKFLKYVEQHNLGNLTLGGDVEDAVHRSELAQARKMRGVTVMTSEWLKVGEQRIKFDHDLWFVIDRDGNWSKPFAFLKDAVALARKPGSKKELGSMSKTAWADLADEGYVSHGYAKSRVQPSWKSVKVSGSSFIGRAYPAARHLAPAGLLCVEAKADLKKCKKRGGACKRAKAEVRKSCAR